MARIGRPPCPPTWPRQSRRVLSIEQAMELLDGDPCPCGRLDRRGAWCCALCVKEKEVAYALSEIDREGEAWPGMTWARFDRQRLEKVAGLR